MSIINSIYRKYDQEEPHSLSSMKQACKVLSHDNEYINEILECFGIENDEDTLRYPIAIGNVKQLLSDISVLDEKSKKIDVTVGLKNIYLEKVLENDHVLFHIFGINAPEIINDVHADHLIVESQYSARTDIMEYYQFSKFASYLHSNKMDGYAQEIWERLRISLTRGKKCMARLLYDIENRKYFIRAVTSDNVYKKYGVNFSVLVALLAVNKYVNDRKEHAFIESYSLDDSHVTMSIQFDHKIQLDSDMYLIVYLILENDEIRQSSVTINTEFRVVYTKENRESDVFIKPTSFQKENGVYSEDMLTYSHGMNVKTAIDRISNLPILIDKYISMVSKNAIAIHSIKNPQHISEFIQHKIQYSRKEEFVGYKKAIIKKLASIEVHTIYDLFDLLRSVEELFGDDIKSKSFWRQKLYHSLIRRGEGE